MKNIYILMGVSILVLVVAAGAFLRIKTPNHNTSFRYSASSTAIKTEVIYVPGQAAAVERYIDSCLGPKVVFGDHHKVNKEVRIDSSRLRYHIKGSPGELYMAADKRHNSISSLNKLRNIFEGLKRVIKPI